MLETIKDYPAIIADRKRRGRKLRSDAGQPILSNKPEWFDINLFERAKSVYARHFMGINFAHLSGLLLLVRVSSIFETLCLTGKSDSVAKLFTRYYHTLIHVKKWYEGDIFEDGSDANRSLLIVRGMHNRVSSQYNTTLTAATAKDVNQNEFEASSCLFGKLKSGEVIGSHDDVAKTMHISEYDIMITQVAFIGFIVTRPKNVGLIEDFNQDDLKSMIHFWRVIGYYMGVSDEFNLCSGESDEVLVLCEALMEHEFKESILANSIDSQHGMMSVNIVRSLRFIPMLTKYGIMRYLYELLSIDTAELEREPISRHSMLSYALIKLVMSNLLAYKPLRCFNNGLTRMSIFFVSKIEDSFVDHLNKKYGQRMAL